MSVCSVDFETVSDLDLLKVGVYRYVESPHTDIRCMAWAFDEDEPEIWYPGDPFPADVALHIAAGGEMRAWNAEFERNIWRAVGGPKHGFPEVALEQWFCTAAEAAAMALPRKLEHAAAVCKVGVEKDMVGHRLTIKMSKPRKPKKTEPDGLYWHPMTPEIRAAIGSYCKQDVRVEKAMYRCTRRLIPIEREVYMLDQRINTRGVYLDLPLVCASQKIAKQAVDLAIAGLQEITGGMVSGPTKVIALKQWIENQGIAAPSLAKKSVAIMLENADMPEEVRDAIAFRQEAGKASTKKLDTMRRVVCADSRMKGLKLYHGAGTGRWAGRFVQPDNMPRGEVGKGVEKYIEAVMRGAYEEIDILNPPLVVISSLLRSMLRAAPGHDLLCSDYAAIECRGVNWIAMQDDVLDLFQQGDALPASDKKGKAEFDPYRHMAMKMGRGATPGAVSDKDRQAGKAAELGCGFQMGGAKFVTAAWDVYQVRLDAKEANAAVKIYRETHPAVVEFWKEVNSCALGAVDAPGSVHRCGRNNSIKITYRGAYLYIILPSGRPLMYPKPSIVERKVPWGDGSETRPAVQFWGIDQKTHQWCPGYLYGGLITENIVQALARDLLADGMCRLDKSGFPPILHVHDEVVAEVPKEYPPEALAEFEKILRTPPAWAKDFPIMTEGWRGERYRK